MTKRRGRGEGSIHFLESKKLWCAQLTTGYNEIGLRKRRYVYGQTKKDVQKKLLELQTQASGSFSDPKRMRVTDYLKHWLEDVAKPTIRESTFVRYEGLLRLHVMPSIGGLQLNAIQPSHIQNLYRQLEKDGASPRTREFVHAVLRKALQQALRWGYVQRNVCDLVTKARVPKRTMNCWNVAQVNHFLEVARGDRLFALYVIALTTGLRQGELFGLRWEDIDLHQNSLSVQRIVCEVAGRISFGEPKTAKGRRRVELPASAVVALKEHRERMLQEGLHLGLVFCNAKGGPISKSNFRRDSFLPLLKEGNFSHTRFHDLRHTAATLLLSQGVHPKIVQERLGHAQIAITLDTYSHVLPSMQKEAAQKLDELLTF